MIIKRAQIILPHTPCATVVLQTNGKDNITTYASDSITINEIQAHVEYLASPDLAGRAAGHRGAMLAAGYVTRKLHSWGFEPLASWWELPFFAPNIAKQGDPRLTFGSNSITGSTAIQAPHCTEMSVVRAGVVDANENVHNRIALVSNESFDRSIAAGLIKEGAVGVIFVSKEPVLKPAPPHKPMQLNGEITAEELIAELPEDDPFRNELLATVRLDAPVVEVSGNAGKQLHEVPGNNTEITIEIPKRGDNRSTNVIGVLRGADPVLREEYILIGAHYDHVGAQGKEIMFGADDNASGVSGILEIAEALASLERRPDRSIIIAAWGAEESGIIGSRAFCNAPPIRLDSIKAVLNLDMIGRNDPNAVQVLSHDTRLRDIAIKAANHHGFTDTSGDPLYLGASDSAPFAYREIPTLFLFSGIHADLNTPRDTVDRLDMDKATRIARAAMDIAVELAND